MSPLILPVRAYSYSFYYSNPPLDVYNAARRVVENAALANAAADTARLAKLNFQESLLDYRQLAGHQKHAMLLGVWSSTYSSIGPFNEVMSLDTDRVKKRVERLRGFSYGGLAALSSSAPVAGTSRSFIHTRPGV